MFLNLKESQQHDYFEFFSKFFGEFSSKAPEMVADSDDHIEGGDFELDGAEIDSESEELPALGLGRTHSKSNTDTWTEVSIEV